MSDDQRDTQRMLFGDPGPPGAGLSVAVVVLMVLATMAAAIGFLRLPDPMLGLGLIGVAVFLAVGARICQARNQHQALYRLLSRQPPP
ncbi:transmembrane protein [Stenotrophomonas maltophilia]|nr:transmembrane protein [Stenotrophomonas maltophilia]